MSIDSEVRRLMRDMEWSQGVCDICERSGSVAPFHHEDGLTSYLCFIDMKNDVRYSVKQQLVYGNYS